MNLTIKNTTKININRINNAVSILYFTDKLNNKVNIPFDTVLYSYDYQYTKKNCTK